MKDMLVIQYFSFYLLTLTMNVESFFLFSFPTW